MACTHTLRDQGKPYPRTCSECGLGPCHYKRDDHHPATPPPVASDALVQELVEALKPIQDEVRRLGPHHPDEDLFICDVSFSEADARRIAALLDRIGEKT